MSRPALETLHKADSPSYPSPFPRDRLTTLPPELFDYIYDIVSKDRFVLMSIPRRLHKTYLGGVSRVFLHQERTRRFSNISITTTERLHKLYTTVVESPGCRPYIEAIDLSFAGPGQSETYLRNEQLVSLLDSLPSLHSLKVRHFPRFARLLSNPPRWFKPLPRLTLLDLADNFDDWDDPFDPIHWSILDHYPNLRMFGLNVEGDAYWRCIPCFNSANIQVSPISSIDTLRLGGPLGSAPYLEVLYNLFPNIKILSVEEVSAHSGSLDATLSRFSRPTQIQHLSIIANYEQRPLIDGTLRLFSNLVTLHLDGRAYDSTVVPIIQSAFKHLRQLYIEWEVDHRDVRRLFEENKALDLLHVDGIRVSENGDSISPITNVFVTTLLDLVAAARINGVELDGPAIWNARETKGRLERIAKAKTNGITDEETWLDEMELDNTERLFRRTYGRRGQ